MKLADEHWRDQDLNVLRLPEGESAKRERLTIERLEAISTFLSTPGWERGKDGCPRDLSEMAASIRSTHGNLKRWVHDPRMTARVVDKLWQAACYALPDILFGQIVAASPVIRQNEDGSVTVVPGDTKAANYVTTVAKVIRSGFNIQQVQNQFESTTEANEHTDEELRELNEALNSVKAKVTSLEGKSGDHPERP